MSTSNQLCRFAATALRVIFLDAPVRTSLGVVLGLALRATIRGFGGEELNKAIEMDHLQGWIGIVSVGLVIMHLRRILEMIFRPTIVDEPTDAALRILKQKCVSKALHERCVSTLAIEQVNHAVAAKRSATRVIIGKME